jgi:hypothetical protein
MSNPTSRIRSWSLIALASILLCVLLLQVLPKPIAYHYRLEKSLAQWLPAPLPGWTFKDISIASTPEVAEAVDELLNFSDGVYRVYRSENTGKEIKVYVAYWVPGKMDPRLVGVHSPDVCWVGAGWKQVGDKRRRTLASSAPTGGLSNGHDRTFEIHGQRENVVFWHLIGGALSRYLEPGEGFWLAGEIFRNPFTPRYEQFFLRISTSDHLDEVANDPMMKRIVDVLSVLQAPLAPSL